MSPRATSEAAERGRADIAAQAADTASMIGLEGLTLGRVARDAGISKAGLVGRFGSKEELQLAAVEAAVAVFRREVWGRAAGEEPGMPRLKAMLDAWVGYFEREVFPGGCFITAASTEFDDRPGRVRQAVAQASVRWEAAIAQEVLIAVKAREMPRSTSPEDTAFLLNSVGIGCNQALRLHEDKQAPERTRRVMAQVLGVLSI